MHFTFFVEIHSENVNSILVLVLMLVALDAGTDKNTSGPDLSSGPPLGGVRLAQEKITIEIDTDSRVRFIFIH